MENDKDRIGSYAYCDVCGRPKCPRGRDPGIYAYGGFCDFDCIGYNQGTLPGDLWPGESAEDFGYPCQTTEERNRRKELP